MGLLCLLPGVSWRYSSRVGEAGRPVHEASAGAGDCRRRAFHDAPAAGWAGNRTSPPAAVFAAAFAVEFAVLVPGLAPAGDLGPSGNARLFSVAVRDSSDRAACAADDDGEGEAVRAEGMWAKRGR
jgi:hypothetical protein